jgi:hypothetical protein
MTKLIVAFRNFANAPKNETNNEALRGDHVRPSVCDHNIQVFQNFIKFGIRVLYKMLKKKHELREDRPRDTHAVFKAQLNYCY